MSGKTMDLWGDASTLTRSAFVQKVILKLVVQKEQSEREQWTQVYKKRHMGESDGKYITSHQGFSLWNYKYCHLQKRIWTKMSSTELTSRGAHTAKKNSFVCSQTHNSRNPCFYRQTLEWMVALLQQR